MSETIAHTYSGQESYGNPEAADEIAREQLLRMEKASREGDVVYTDFGNLPSDLSNQRYLQERCFAPEDGMQAGVMIGLPPDGRGIEKITVVKDKKNNLATDLEGRFMFNFFHDRPRTDVDATNDYRFLTQASNFRSFIGTEGEWRTLVMASPEEMAKFEITIVPNPRAKTHGYA